LLVKFKLTVGETVCLSSDLHFLPCAWVSLTHRW